MFQLLFNNLKTAEIPANVTRMMVSTIALFYLDFEMKIDVFLNSVFCLQHLQYFHFHPVPLRSRQT